MTLGEKIRDLRQENGESQMALAVALGYKDYHIISHMEKDKIPLSDTTLCRIAEHYGKPKEYFRKEHMTTERQRQRRRVNDYCVWRLRNGLSCHGCKGFDKPVCVSELFFRGKLETVRKTVEDLINETEEHNKKISESVKRYYGERKDK